VKIEKQIESTSDELKNQSELGERRRRCGQSWKAFGTAVAALGAAAVGAASALASMTVSAAAYADEVMTLQQIRTLQRTIYKNTNTRLTSLTAI
jgi:DMSO/TMAO reductase YedYZ molybdopterin-dependent catalytic subunit